MIAPRRTTGSAVAARIVSARSSTVPSVGRMSARTRILISCGETFRFLIPEVTGVRDLLFANTAMPWERPIAIATASAPAIRNTARFDTDDPRRLERRRAENTFDGGVRKESR